MNKIIAFFMLFSMMTLTACQSSPSTPVEPANWGGRNEAVYTQTGTPWDKLKGKFDEHQAARYIRATVALDYYESVNGNRPNRSDRAHRQSLQREVQQSQNALRTHQNELRRNYQGRRRSLVGTIVWSEEDLTSWDVINEVRNYELARMRAALVNPQTTAGSGNGEVVTRPVNGNQVDPASQPSATPPNPAAPEQVQQGETNAGKNEPSGSSQEAQN